MLVNQKQVTKLDFSFSQMLDTSTYSDLSAKKLLGSVKPPCESMLARTLKESLVVLT
jgi:hypothetical protein